MQSNVNAATLSVQAKVLQSLLTSTVERTLAPTRILFSILIVVAILSIVIPLSLNYFSAGSWAHFAKSVADVEGENQVLARILWSLWITFAFVGIFAFGTLSVLGYRRWVRQSLKNTSPPKCKVKGLKQVSDEDFQRVINVMNPHLPANIGRIGLLPNERTTESYVVGTTEASWIVLSDSDLDPQKGPERLRFVVLHELSHIVHGDHKMLGWVQAILKASFLVYLFCLIPLTFVGLVSTENSKWATASLVGEDAAFILILLFQLWTVTELLKRREIDADLQTRDWMGAPDILKAIGENVSITQNKMLASIRDVWNIVLGRRHHPTLANRQAFVENPALYVNPRAFLTVFAGFCTTFVGVWGLVIPELMTPFTEFAERNDFSVIFPRIPALQATYPLRWLLCLASVGVVAMELGRDMSTWEYFSLRIRKVAWWFTLGILSWIPLSFGKAFLSGEPLHIVIIGMVFLCIQMFPFTIIFTLFVGTVLWAIRPSHPNPDRKNELSFPIWRLAFLPFILYFVLWIIGVDWFTPTNYEVGLRNTLFFLIGALLVVLVIGRPFFRHSYSRHDSINSPLQATSQLNSRKTLGITSVLGGALGGIFGAIIPINLMILNSDLNTLLNAYPKLWFLLVFQAAMGFLAGGYRWLLANTQRQARIIFFTLAIILFIEILMPFAIGFFLPAAAVVVAMSIADRLRGSKPHYGQIRYKIGFCIISAIALALTVGTVINSLLAILGYPIGILRNLGGEPSSLPLIPAIMLETFRLMTDSVLNALFIGFGIALTESVFGGPKREKPETVVFGDLVPSL